MTGTTGESLHSVSCQPPPETVAEGARAGSQGQGLPLMHTSISFQGMQLTAGIQTHALTKGTQRLNCWRLREKAHGTAEGSHVSKVGMLGDTCTWKRVLSFQHAGKGQDAGLYMFPRIVPGLSTYYE